MALPAWVATWKHTVRGVATIITNAWVKGSLLCIIHGDITEKVLSAQNGERHHESRETNEGECVRLQWQLILVTGNPGHATPWMQMKCEVRTTTTPLLIVTLQPASLLSSNAQYILHPPHTP